MIIIIYYLLTKRNKSIDRLLFLIDSKKIFVFRWLLLNRWLVPINLYFLLLHFAPGKMVTSGKCKIIIFGWNSLKSKPTIYQSKYTK